MVLTYIGVVLIGLLHGLEPGHGWPVAVLYSLKKDNKFGFGLISSLILSFAHFASSIAVVLVFIFLNQKYDLAANPIIKYLSVALLLFLAYRFWTEKEDSDKHESKVKTLKSIVIFAFILGFVHEEEFALLAFCLEGINCLLLMISYATAVTLSLVGITLMSLYAYQKIEGRLHKYERYLPKISAVILLVMTLFYLLRILAS